MKIQFEFDRAMATVHEGCASLLMQWTSQPAEWFWCWLSEQQFWTSTLFWNPLGCLVQVCYITNAIPFQRVWLRPKPRILEKVENISMGCGSKIPSVTRGWLRIKCVSAIVCANIYTAGQFIGIFIFLKMDFSFGVTLLVFRWWPDTSTIMGTWE